MKEKRPLNAAYAKKFSNKNKMKNHITLVHENKEPKENSKKPKRT